MQPEPGPAPGMCMSSAAVLGRRSKILTSQDSEDACGLFSHLRTVLTGPAQDSHSGHRSTEPEVPDPDARGASQS